jgi:hypothetical protein
MTKQCQKCFTNGTLAEFTKDARQSDGLNRYCRTCTRAYTKQWRNDNPDKFRDGVKKCHTANPEIQREASFKYRLKQYGLTPEQYEVFVVVQGGACAICGTAHLEDLCIDHDHESGTVRGLLCQNCNKGLGLFQDSADNLYHASDYLTRAV